MAGLNERVFRFVNGWPDSWAPFWQFFSEAANHLWFKVTVLVLVVAMVVAGKRARSTVIQVLIAWPIANGMTDLFKNFLPEPRPFQELVTGFTLRGISITNHSHGTASAHAANMAAIAFAFTYGLGWWGVPWIVIALLTGISRIYVGAHYPYQVLLGWTCGIVAGLLVTQTRRLIAGKLKARETKSASPAAPR
jgi:undecaprenyl-diphosphatase